MGPIGYKLSAKIDQPGDPGRRTDKTRCGQIEMLHLELCLERSLRKIVPVDEARLSFEHQGRVSWSFGGQLKWKLRCGGKVVRLEIDIGVKAGTLLATNRADVDPAIGNDELLNAKIGRFLVLHVFGFGFRTGSSQTRKIPGSGTRLEESDFGL